MPSVASVSGVTSSAGSHGKSRSSATVCGGVPAPGRWWVWGCPGAFHGQPWGSCEQELGDSGWAARRPGGDRAELRSGPRGSGTPTLPVCQRTEVCSRAQDCLQRGGCGKGTWACPVPPRWRPAPALAGGRHRVPVVRAEGRKEQEDGGKWLMEETNEHALSSHGSCRGPAGAASRLRPGNAAGNCQGHS